MSIINQIADLESQLAALEAQKNELNASGFIDASEMARIQDQANVISNHLAELYELREQEQERVQKQEEEVQSTGLPAEFVELFDPKDVEMIVELLRIQKAESFTKHNTEVNALTAEYKGIIKEIVSQRDEFKESYHKAVADAVDQKNKLEHVTYELEQAEKEIKEALTANSETVNELIEANKEIERLNSQVDDLRAEIAIGAVQAAKIIVPSSDRLSQMIQERKETKKYGSNLDLVLAGEKPFRGKVELGTKEPAEETATTFQGPVQDSDQYTATTDFIIDPPVMDFRTTEESAGPELAEGTSQLAGQVSRQEFNELSQEVAELRRKVSEIVGYEEVA